MLKNITKRQRRKIEEHVIQFMYDNGCGFEFPCDEQGTLLPDLTPEARANYEHCMAHPELFPVAWNSFRRRVRSYMEPAVGTCVCGTRVELYGAYMGAEKCPGCGRWYNIYGQELLPPEQWESEEEPW